MPPPGPHLRLRVQTKVLIPVLAFLVLVPAIMVAIVGNQSNQQLLAHVREVVSTANNVFIQRLNRRSNDLLLRARTSAREAHYQAIANEAQKASATSDTGVMAFLGDLLDEYGDECEIAVFTSERASAPIWAQRNSSS